MQSVTIAYWVADKLGANESIFGEVARSEATLNLSLGLLRLSDAKLAAHWNLASGSNEELKSRVGQSLEWSVPELHRLAMRCSENGMAGIEVFKAAGGTLPKMTYWPNPPYTEEARKNKMQGKRRYTVILDTTLVPFLILPQRPAEAAFDRIAVETIKTWRGQPAILGGKAVAACVTFEVNWRLY